MKLNQSICCLVAGCAIALALPACSAKKDESPAAGTAGKPTVLNAEGFVVRAQPFQSDYTTSGSLLPNEVTQILPEISGRITSITFKEGTHVTKGQLLVQLYNDDIRAQIQKSDAQRELQLKIKERQAKLLSIGGISQQDYESTTAQIQSIDADIAYSRAQLRKTSILAPFEGRVGIRNVSLGAVVTPGTIIASLQQSTVLKMDFTLPEQYKDEVPVGKQISFTVTGNLDTFSGTISAIEPSADAVTRTLKVRALVENKKEKLTAGSFTHVVVPFINNKSALMIPPQSVIPTDRDKEVAVVKNGKAKLVPVTIGARTNSQVEIIQGLKAGDTILTTGIMQVKQNMSVKIVKVKGAE